ncbi:MAG: DUF2142 domain-containing protein [Clostridia bacterium]|nr:DUF2142 domain-containing protein [Clostridia bacterium]
MKRIKEKHLKIIYIILITSIAIAFAILMPINSGPDEIMKMDICKFIAEHNSLPHGGEDAVRDATWGISYGFTPILSYIIGGIFMKITGIFTQDIHALYVSARLVSCICYSIMGIFVIKIGDKLFKNKYCKWIFITFTTMLPQVLFLGSYINNDALALMSIAIIVYAWILGLESKWSIKSSITLAIGIGLCALSYYNAYGYILTSMIIFVVYYAVNKINYKEFLKKGILISFITLAICGWWFVRSYIIYNGDILGMRTTDEYAEKYAIEELKPSNRSTPQNTGMSLYTMLIKEKWIYMTLKSFIAVFGGMEIGMPTYIYALFLLAFLIGFISYAIKFFKKGHFKNMDTNKKILEFAFIFNIFLPIGLSFYYSYFSDFQPQGRYIMPMLIPFMCFITLGISNAIEKYIKQDKTKRIIQIIIAIMPVMLTINCVIHSILYYASIKGE